MRLINLRLCYIEFVMRHLASYMVGFVTGGTVAQTLKMCYHYWKKRFFLYQRLSTLTYGDRVMFSCLSD